MSKNKTKNTISKKQFQNLLEQNPKLGGILRYLQKNKQISENRFLAYTDSNIDQLEEWSIVKYGTGGQLMVLDRINNDYLFLSGEPKRTLDVVRKALEEVQEAGYELPVDEDSESLIYDLANNRDWLDQLNREVWYGNTDRSRKVDLETFRHIAIVNKGKPVYLGKEGKRLISELPKFKETYSSEFIEIFDVVQREAGIYTAITKETLPFYTWIYDIIKKNRLNEREIELVLQEIEENLEKGEVTEKQLKKAINKYKSPKEREEETDE